MPSARSQKKQHPLFHLGNEAWRISCTKEIEKDAVQICAVDINITTVLNKNCFKLEETDQYTKVNINKSVALALERYYLERRMDAKEMFRLGSFKKCIPPKNPSGFQDNAKA